MTRPSADPCPDASTSPVWHGQLGGLGQLDRLAGVEPVEIGGRDVELGHPGPAGVDRQVRAVLLGGHADRCGLDPQRHVLGDEHHVAVLGGEVQRDGEDPGVVGLGAEPGRQQRGVTVVELDVQRAAPVTDRHRRVQPAMPDPQVVEQAQGLPGEPAEFGMVPLALQLADHHERQHHVVLGEAVQGVRIGQQDTGVQDVGTASVHGPSP